MPVTTASVVDSAVFAAEGHSSLVRLSVGMRKGAGVPSRPFSVCVNSYQPQDWKVVLMCILTEMLLSELFSNLFNKQF